MKVKNILVSKGIWIGALTFFLFFLWRVDNIVNRIPLLDYLIVILGNLTKSHEIITQVFAYTLILAIGASLGFLIQKLFFKKKRLNFGVKRGRL